MRKPTPNTNHAVTAVPPTVVGVDSISTRERTPRTIQTAGDKPPPYGVNERLYKPSPAENVAAEWLTDKEKTNDSHRPYGY